MVTIDIFMQNSVTSVLYAIARNLLHCRNHLKPGLFRYSEDTNESWHSISPCSPGENLTRGAAKGEPRATGATREELAAF